MKRSVLNTIIFYFMVLRSSYVFSASDINFHNCNYSVGASTVVIAGVYNSELDASSALSAYLLENSGLDDISAYTGNVYISSLIDTTEYGHVGITYYQYIEQYGRSYVQIVYFVWPYDGILPSNCCECGCFNFAGTCPSQCVQTVIDSDSDGVPDSEDICPNTPAGENVDNHSSSPMYGCSCEQGGEPVYIDGGCSWDCYDTDSTWTLTQDVYHNGDVCDHYYKILFAAGAMVHDVELHCNCVELSCQNLPHDAVDLGPATDSGWQYSSHYEIDGETLYCGSAVYLDDDEDGVMNTSDDCPNTANNETVDENGCSCAQGSTILDCSSYDSDGDGISDRYDACPNTPDYQNCGSHTSDGCYACEKDTDSDGVNNMDDRCSGYSAQIGHEFRRIPATYSGINRPPIPVAIGHFVGAERRWIFSTSQICFF